MRSAAVAALILGVLGCGKKEPPPTGPNTGVSSSDTPGPRPSGPADAAPPTAAADDHVASAAAMFDGTNYVAPDELAYSRKKSIVVYPGCSGGEGPGEHCALTGLDHAGKTVTLDDFVQWHHRGGDDQPDRPESVKKIAAALDALDTVRMDRTPWQGTAMDIPSFGRIEWDPKGKALIATADGKTKKVPVEWGERGGPVNVFASPAAPVAVVQLRVNPASGGTEGYVVFIELIVVPRP